MYFLYSSQYTKTEQLDRTASKNCSYQYSPIVTIHLLLAFMGGEERFGWERGGRRRQEVECVHVCTNACELVQKVSVGDRQTDRQTDTDRERQTELLNANYVVHFCDFSGIVLCASHVSCTGIQRVRHVCIAVSGCLPVTRSSELSVFIFLSV